MTRLLDLAFGLLGLVLFAPALYLGLLLITSTMILAGKAQVRALLLRRRGPAGVAIPPAGIPATWR